MSRRNYPDPGPQPENATPQEIAKWRRDQEKFLTEGGRSLPTERPKIDATDERLKELQRDHARFLEKMNPATDALWLALLKSGKDVLLDVEMFDRYDRAMRAGTRAEAPDIPAIMLIAERQVASAIRGDNTAAAAIADRIEGRPGLRSGDVNPDDPEQVKRRREVVEDVVRTLTDHRLRAKIASAEDATAVLVPVPVKESDGSETVSPSGPPLVRPQEPREAAQADTERVAGSGDRASDASRAD